MAFHEMGNADAHGELIKGRLVAGLHTRFARMTVACTLSMQPGCTAHRLVCSCHLDHIEPITARASQYVILTAWFKWAKRLRLRRSGGRGGNATFSSQRCLACPGRDLGTHQLKIIHAHQIQIQIQMSTTNSLNNIPSAKIALIDHTNEARQMREIRQSIDVSLQQVGTAPRSTKISQQAHHCHAVGRPVQKQCQCGADLKMLQPFAVDSQLVLVYREGEEVDIANALLLLLNQHIHFFKKSAITVATLLRQARGARGNGAVPSFEGLTIANLRFQQSYECNEEAGS